MQKTLSGWPFPRSFASEFPFTVGKKATSCKQWMSCRRLESDTGTSEHLALKMLTSRSGAKRKSLQLLPVRWLGHLRRTGKAWRLGLEQMLPRSEEPVIKSSMGVQTLSRTRLVSTQYKVGVWVLQSMVSVLEGRRNGLWWIPWGSSGFQGWGLGLSVSDHLWAHKTSSQQLYRRKKTYPWPKESSLTAQIRCMLGWFSYTSLTLAVQWTHLEGL